METELKIQFPNVIKYDVEHNTYAGVFKNDEKNNNVFVQFYVPNNPSAEGIRVKTSTKLPKHLLKCLETNSKTQQFIEYLKCFQQALYKVPAKSTFDIDRFQLFYSELKANKSKYPDELFVFDAQRETISIIHCDAYSVKNQVTLKLNLSKAELNLYTVLSHSFPESTNRLFPDAANSLGLIHKQFLKIVDNLSDFHDAMQRIDSMCWVNAPLNPSPAHNYRTIVISDLSHIVSMKVSFKPWSMWHTPEFTFYGPSTSIDVHRRNLSENLANWDSTYDILQNILNVLDLPFFSMKHENESPSEEIVLFNQENECCICFSYYLSEMIPDVVCEFESCRRRFHNACLFEWLSMLPNVQIMYGFISGTCPNCEKNISCKLMEA